MNEIKIYDTTLRDGSQQEGISLSVADKLKICKRLDAFGVHYIEGGWPGSNPKDAEFFTTVVDVPLKTARIVAFGSTRHKNAPTADDPNIKALEDAHTPAVALVGKSWDFHVTAVLETTLEENLAMIEESVAYFKKAGKEVIYDAEHFFDGYKANPSYAMATLKAAVTGGADVLVLCETNGGAMPWEVEEMVREVKKQFSTPLGIHAHNDSECGVANSLAAVRAGAVHVQGTINGYGERVGNANLVSIIPNLQLKMGYQAIPPENMPLLTDLSRYVSEIANVLPSHHQPFVGKSAFAHKGGIHVAAMLKAAATYQHIDPALVGNEQRTVISELSGRGNVLQKAQEFGIAADEASIRQLLQQIKKQEANGYSFEAAEASVELMLKRMDKAYVPPFELIDFMVVVEHRKGLGIFSEASVKLQVGDCLKHTAAEGNGPVNAMNIALRKALTDTYPSLKDVHLDDYKVRILDSQDGTAATVRVMITSKKRGNSWSTIGASTNIIEASWKALADSLEYALLQPDQSDEQF